MVKNGSTGGQFAIDIKGFEEFYKFIRNIFIENKWSLSSVQQVIRRFIEGFKYDGILPENLDYNDLKNRIYKIRKNQYDRQSRDYFVNQYGENLGLIKFAHIQYIQALVNSQKYKGMTDEEFKEFNKSRAVTKELCIKRHGEEEGLKIWNEYKNKQSYTKSKQRYIDEDRLDDFDEINKKKVNNIDNFIERYGEEEGTKKYLEYFENNQNYFFSKEASSLFEELDNYFKFSHVYYAPKTQEFGKFDAENKCYYYYDFVLPDINLCIEFNGDIFHANPKTFNESDTPNPYKKDLTAKEIWEHDKRKLDLLKKNNYNIIIVWESDYNKDRQKNNRKFKKYH